MLTIREVNLWTKNLSAIGSRSCGWKKHFWIPVELGTGTKPWLHPGYFLRPSIAFHEAILKYLRIFWNNAPAIFWRYRKYPTACQKGVGWHQDIIRWWFNYIAWSYRTAESRKMTAGAKWLLPFIFPYIIPHFRIHAKHCVNRILNWERNKRPH